MPVRSEILIFFVWCLPIAQAAFDPTSYPRSQQLDPSMLIYWKLQSNSIQIALKVRFLDPFQRYWPSLVHFLLTCDKDR
jgi:hypothetical protein